jgi:putative aldouronate transport system substrate-binding protein
MMALQVPASVHAAEEEPKYGERSEFTWALPASINEKMATLNPQEQETFLNIITNKAPVSAWDTWVADWKKNGGDAVTAEYNKLYEEDTKA